MPRRIGEPSPALKAELDEVFKKIKLKRNEKELDEKQYAQIGLAAANAVLLMVMKMATKKTKELWLRYTAHKEAAGLSRTKPGELVGTAFPTEGGLHEFNYFPQPPKGQPKKYWFRYIAYMDYADHLSLTDVLFQVTKDFENGRYNSREQKTFYEKYITRDMVDSGKMSLLDLDEQVVDALRISPDFFQNKEPGMRILREHLEKRIVQAIHGKYEERSEAARAIRMILHYREGSAKSVFPKYFYVTGLIAFLLPIAMRDKIKPEKHLKEILIPSYFGISPRSLKDRLLEESK